MASSASELFNFNETFASLVTRQHQEHSDVFAEASDSDLKLALDAAGEAAYRWNIDTDEIVWSPNAAKVLQCPIAAIATGKQFASLLDAENVTSRFETVMNSTARDSGDGVRFQIEYMFKSHGRDQVGAVWLEDIGRWRAGPDGVPVQVHGTLRRIDERHNRDQHLNFLGNCDPLTGMMNRGRLLEALGDAVSVAQRNALSCCFVIASINNLALVNESYGFDVADEVIVSVGRRLRQVMRIGDGIARYSGSKFGIILNDCDAEELDAALRRYLSVVHDSVIETSKGPVWATLSAGAVILPMHAATASQATGLAEEALNEARKLPSDGYLVHQPSERKAALREFNARCATEIVRCLKEDSFRLAFQPIVHAKTNEIAMHEALLRMQENCNSEFIVASHLIPVAERLGLIRLVDRAVMQLIMQTLNNHDDATLSMNVSAATAMDPHWYGQLLDVIHGNQRVASRLTIEITETVALSDLKSTQRFVEQLRKAGCAVAIDDFGSGYTSLHNLRELPVNILKLDGTFCRGVAKNRDNGYVVRNLIDLSAKFGLKTVAEWVEAEEDAAVLRDWGVDYLQGNHMGEVSLQLPWGHGAAQARGLQESAPMAFLEGQEFDFVAAESRFVFESAAATHSIVTALEVPEASLQSSIDLQIEQPSQSATEQSIVAGEYPLTLDFSEIDESIARLRASMQALNTGEQTPLGQAAIESQAASQAA